MKKRRLYSINMSKKNFLYIFALLINALFVCTSTFAQDNLYYEYDIDKAVEYDDEGFVTEFNYLFKYQFRDSNYLQARTYAFESFMSNASNAFDVTRLDNMYDGEWRPYSIVYEYLDPATMEPLRAYNEDASMLIEMIDIDKNSSTYNDAKTYMDYYNQRGQATMHRFGKMLNVQGISVYYIFPSSGYKSSDISKAADYLDRVLQFNEEVSLMDDLLSKDIRKFNTQADQTFEPKSYVSYKYGGCEIDVFVVEDYGIGVTITKPDLINARNFKDVANYYNAQLLDSGVLYYVAQ